MSVQQDRDQRSKDMADNQRYIEEKLSRVVEPMIINVLNNKQTDPVSSLFIFSLEIHRGGPYLLPAIDFYRVWTSKGEAGSCLTVKAGSFS